MREASFKNWLSFDPGNVGKCYCNYSKSSIAKLSNLNIKYLKLIVTNEFYIAEGKDGYAEIEKYLLFL